MKTSHLNDKDIFNARLNTLTEIVSMKFDELVDSLGLDLSRRSNKFQGPCPIHGGDNPDALLLYPEGHSNPGYWVCQTHHCELHFRQTMTGFVQGVLSHQKYGWQRPRDREVSFRTAVNYLCNLIGMELHEIYVDTSMLERQNFELAVEEWNVRKIQGQGGLCTREQMRKHLAIPVQYYLDRQYKPTTLDRYDVGFMSHPKSVLSGRIVVPVYDEMYKMVVGAIGRTVQSACTKCKYFHESGLPCPLTPQEKASSCKWRTSSTKEKKFVDKDWLYNYWFSRDDILKTRCVVIVEGPGDVWRLDEAGVKNSVAIFGNDPSNRQVITLECSGTTSIIALTDNDKAGQAGVKAIEKKCDHFATVYRPQITAKDIGEMSVEDIRKHLVPFISSKTRRL